MREKYFWLVGDWRLLLEWCERKTLLAGAGEEEQNMVHILNPGEGGYITSDGTEGGEVSNGYAETQLKIFRKKRNTTQKGGATNLDDARTDLERKLRLHQHF